MTDDSSVVDYLEYFPCILFRKVEVSDIEELKKLDDELFEVKYGPAFYQSLVSDSCSANPSKPVILSLIAVIAPAQSDIMRAPLGEGNDSRTFDSDSEEVGRPEANLNPREVYPRIVGVCTARVNILNRPFESYISTFGVTKSYRGKGLGKCLLYNAIEMLKRESHIEIIRLDCLATNKTAIDFYCQKAGFSITKRLHHFYSFGGKFHDAFHMELDLRPPSTDYIWTCLII